MAARLQENPFSGMDPGLAGALSSITGAGVQQAPEPLTLTDLQALLTGTARQSVTTRPFVGAIPSWVPPELKPYVRQGAIDPYLGTGQDKSAYRVFMGRETSQKRERRTIRHVDGETVVAKNVLTGKTGKQDKTMTMPQAADEPYLWDQNKVGEAIKKFQSAGLTNVTDFDSLVQAWGSLVDRAGSMYSLSSGKKKVTPWDVLDLYKNEMVKAGTLPPDPNRTVTQVSKSVQDISEGDAFTALQTSLSNMLGRDPSDQELRDFTYRMNSLAAHNPSITRTITKYKNGEVGSQSSHTSEGFGANDVAESAYKQAQSDPDHAEFQSATTYFNAALSALGPIGG